MTIWTDDESGGTVWSEDEAAGTALGAETGSSLVGFIHSGTAPTARTIQSVERAIVRSGDYASSTNFLSKLEELTETFGVARLNIQQNDGIRWQTSTGYGPFMSHTLQSTFNGTVDNVWMFASYNIAEGTAGTKIVSAEPALAFQMEADYNNGSAHLMEVNLDYTSDDGGVAARRFMSLTIDRSTDVGSWGFWSNTFTLRDSTNTYAPLTVTATSTTGAVALSDGTTLGVGTAANTTRSILTGGTALTGTQQWGVLAGNIFNSSATVAAYGYATALSTAAASFTCADFINFHSGNVVKGAGSTITNQYGFFSADLTNGTSNYGFYGALSAGANKYNLLMNGTAQNWLKGVTAIGATAPSTTANLLVAASATGVSSLRIPHGTAPSSPVNGDIWTTTAGLFVQVNGSTVGPLS